MKPRLIVALLAALALAGATYIAAADDQVQIAAAAATWPGCDSFKTQPEAQRAWENSGRPARADGDKDGKVCESLPPAGAPPAGADSKSCKHTRSTIKVVYSRAKYPNIIRHITDSIAKGYPRLLRINRIDSARRRAKLLAGIPTAPGMDRDEYPPDVARGRGTGVGDTHADVRLVPASENRSSGSVLGHRLSPYCNGTHFTFIFRP